MKLAVLAHIFGITPSLAKSIYNSFVQYLSNILKSSVFIPTLEDTRKCILKCFDDFKNIKIIIVGCLEISIQKQKCPCCKIKTYAHYKGRNTFKCMIGISPAVSFGMYVHSCIMTINHYN